MARAGCITTERASETVKLLCHKSHSKVTGMVQMAEMLLHVSQYQHCPHPFPQHTRTHAHHLQNIYGVVAPGEIL